MKYEKNLKDVYVSTEEELVKRIQTGSKDQIVYYTGEKEVPYVISKEIYEDLKVFGLGIEISGHEYKLLLELSDKMVLYHGPAVKELIFGCLFDFSLYAYVTYEVFGDTDIGSDIEKLQVFFKTVFDEFLNTHDKIEFFSYKAQLRTTVFLSRLSTLNRTIIKNSQNLPKGLVIPSSSSPKGNGRPPFSQN